MKSKLDRWRHALMGSAALASVLIAACGGGTQVQRFVPGRVIAFGDETSVIVDVNGDANGHKWMDNATVSSSDPTFACKLNPNWVQAVGNAYGLVFPQCNPPPDAVVAPPSRDRAAIGAKVADIAGQVDAQIAESAFTPTDLVTVMAGQNDILALYAMYPATTEAELVAAAEAAGIALGDQVNRIANAGAKVLIATTPDLGLTPFGLAEKAAHADVDRSALLSHLTARLNAEVRATIINDGRMIGLIAADEYFQIVQRTVGGGGFTNVIAAVCDPAKAPTTLDCSTLTLITGGSGIAYLWADSTHLASGGQAQLGSLAAQRAANNPF